MVRLRPIRTHDILQRQDTLQGKGKLRSPVGGTLCKCDLAGYEMEICHLITETGMKRKNHQIRVGLYHFYDVPFPFHFILLVLCVSYVQLHIILN